MAILSIFLIIKMNLPHQQSMLPHQLILPFFKELLETDMITSDIPVPFDSLYGFLYKWVKETFPNLRVPSKLDLKLFMGETGFIHACFNYYFKVAIYILNNYPSSITRNTVEFLFNYANNRNDAELLDFVVTICKKNFKKFKLECRYKN